MSFLGDRPGSATFVTMTFIVLCVLVYLLQSAMSSLVVNLAFAPYIGREEPYRFLSSAFLHVSIPHLLFNLWALWLVGSSLEPFLGKLRFASIYLISAVGGSVAVLLLSSPTSLSWYSGTIGASGAIFGLFATVYIVQRHSRRDTTSITGLIIINFAISFLGAGISWQAHVGGFVTGAAISYLYSRSLRQSRRQRDIHDLVATVVVVMVLVGASLVRYLIDTWL